MLCYFAFVGENKTPLYMRNVWHQFRLKGSVISNSKVVVNPETAVKRTDDSAADAAALDANDEAIEVDCDSTPK